MLTNEIWLRKTIVFTNRVLLIHRKRSPFPAGEGIVKSQFFVHLGVEFIIKINKAKFEILFKTAFEKILCLWYNIRYEVLLSKVV